MSKARILTSSIVFLLVINLVLYFFVSSNFSFLLKNLIVDIILILFLVYLLEKGSENQERTKTTRIMTLTVYVGFFCMVVGFPLILFGVSEQNGTMISSAMVLISIAFLSVPSVMSIGLYLKNKKFLKPYLASILIWVAAIIVFGLLTVLSQNFVLVVLSMLLVFAFPIFIFLYPLVILWSSLLREKNSESR